ncbi:MAG: hypothetical protein NHB14_15755 [Desulfosporosinus sp.]|nr:hypothetical protein [Desulfosporosinus sp.]
MNKHEESLEFQMQRILWKKPDRGLIGEVRGDVIEAYLRIVPDNHPGVITTCHAPTHHQGFCRILECKH